MKAKIFVTLKEGVLDPQGKAIGQALNNLGFDDILDVRQGKVIEIELKDTDEAKARKRLEAMCLKLIANTVIEDYRIVIEA